MAQNQEEIRVTFVIPLKGGKIRVEGIPEVPKEKVSKIPLGLLASMEGPHFLRYKGSYCIVIEFMGSYYQYCI